MSFIEIRLTPSAVQKVEQDYQEALSRAHWTRETVTRPSVTISLPGGGRIEIGRWEINTDPDVYR